MNDFVWGQICGVLAMLAGLSFGFERWIIGLTSLIGSVLVILFVR